MAGVDFSGQNVSNKFPPGVAYAKFGFLWNYTKKDDQVWATNISVREYRDAYTVNGHTVNADVPSGAKFTDTKYTASTSKLVTTTVPNVTNKGTTPSLTITSTDCDDITAWTTNTPTSASVSGGILTISAGTAASLNYTARSVGSASGWSAGTTPTLGTAITVATGSLASNGSGGTVATGITAS